MAPKSEQPPPGSSAHCGSFATAAFAATIFPDKGHRNMAFKTRLHHRNGEHHSIVFPAPSALHAAHVEFALTKEATRPSRLRRCYDEHHEIARMSKSTGFLSRSTPDFFAAKEQEALQSTASQPTLQPPMSAGPMTQSHRLSSRSMSSMASTARSSVDEESEGDAMFRASRSMNTRYFPHICANRGELRLSKPAALLAGVDPAKDKAHQDPHFEAPKHRFADVKSLPGGMPLMPTRSLKWSSDLAWNDPSNHAATKVTQTVGGRQTANAAAFGSLVGPRTLAKVEKQERLLLNQ